MKGKKPNTHQPMPPSLSVYKNFKTGQLGLCFVNEYAPAILISPKHAFLVTEGVDYERLERFCKRLNLKYEAEDQFICWRDVAVPIAVQLLKLHLDHLGHRATNHLPGWWEIGRIDTQGLYWQKRPFPACYGELKQATGIDMMRFKAGNYAEQKAMVEDAGILTAFQNTLSNSSHVFKGIIEPDYTIYLSELIAAEAVARLKANGYYTPDNAYSIQLVLKYDPFDVDRTRTSQPRSLFFSRLVDARANELVAQRKLQNQVTKKANITGADTGIESVDEEESYEPPFPGV